MDKGKSTGVGYVRFSNEADAHRAISILFSCLSFFILDCPLTCINIGTYYLALYIRHNTHVQDLLPVFYKSFFKFYKRVNSLY